METVRDGTKMLFTEAQKTQIYIEFESSNGPVNTVNSFDPSYNFFNKPTRIFFPY